MTKKVVTLIALTTLIGLGVVFLYLGLINSGLLFGHEANPSEVDHSDPAMIVEKYNPFDERSLDTPSKVDSETDEQQGEGRDRYIDYSINSFSESLAEKRVLFFYASWCPPCRKAEESFLEHSYLIPENVVVFKVDYDREVDLRQKYAILYQHTFVQVDAGMHELTKWSGGDIEKLLESIR